MSVNLTSTVSTRVTPESEMQIVRAAKLDHRTPAEWIRLVLEEAAAERLNIAKNDPMYVLGFEEGVRHERKQNG